MVMTEKKEIGNLRTDRIVKLALAPLPGYGLTLTPDSVDIQLEVVPIQTRIFEGIPIITYNIAAGLTARTEPAMLSLELTGPPDEISNLQPNAIIAAVDYNNADAAGMAAITIECPSNFKVKRSSTDSARIIIE